MRIAIVEDEYVIRDGISKVISKINSNYKVVGQAADGMEGLELIIKEKPDLVITDIRMPKMDGLEMLNLLKEKGIEPLAIILSAYSEFKYAQKAIVLGVNEYLLKPIAIKDLAASLARIEEKIEAEKNIDNVEIKSIYTLDDIFLNAILGNLNITSELESYLSQKYNINIIDEFMVLHIYMGGNYEENIEELKLELSSISTNNNINFSILEMKKDKSVVVIIYNYDEASRIKEYFQKCIISSISSRFNVHFTYCLGESLGLLSLNDTLKRIELNIQWDFVLKEDTLICKDYIQNIKVKQFLYPISLEHRMKEFIIKKDVEGLKRIYHEFKLYCRNDIYNPEQIKKGIINFSLAAMNTAKEVEGNLSENIDVKAILNEIIKSVSWDELQCLFNNVVNKAFNTGSNSGVSLLIKRTESLIQEYYNQGIKLEEIARKLNVTPDYLGKMFKKEIGESFNSYVKNYRINKVKTLLLGTKLKMYEIAELTGFTDGKYMSQVFKEVVGYLPNEYRKLNK